MQFIVKVPNLHTRKSFNYVRTIDCNITGSIPDIYLNKIKEIFNNGVTLWHINDIGNYSANNEEL